MSSSHTLPSDRIRAELLASRRESTTDMDWDSFEARFDTEFARLQSLFHRIYGPGSDEELLQVVLDAAASWQDRPADLKALDANRAMTPDWFSSHRMLGGVCYVDLYAGSLAGLRERIPYFRELGLTYLHLMPLFLAPEENSDGGYAVSSYREVDPSLGTMDELADLARELRGNGIALVLDFIFNHTSNEHAWARGAVAGDPYYQDFYWIYPDRQMPDAYERTVREIFPDDHPGSFVQLDDGRWVWATFHSFQWDLDYRNPRVFRAMAGEMLYLANQGVDIVRMDAVAFIWKQLGTACESLPEAHLLLQAFNAVCRLAAPSLLFKSEAIVHPDEVVQYIDPGECQLSYNPLQMALIWNSLATREVSLLAQALERRHGIPEGTAWVNYVRGHDDIGWTFSDEDAAEFGIDGYDHRRFLNAFYVDRFPGSFARGVPFQDNPRTGDCRISGTTASLAGLEAATTTRDDQGDDREEATAADGAAGTGTGTGSGTAADAAVARILLAHAIVLSTGGIPLLYLGDEVGQLNDYTYLDDPAKTGDSRWVGRPAYPAEAYAARQDRTTHAGAVFTGLSHLIQVRKQTPEFAGGRLLPFHTHNPHVLAYQRPGQPHSRSDSRESTVLVLANFADTPQDITAQTLSGLPASALELITGERALLRAGVTIEPHGVRWYRL